LKRRSSKWLQGNNAWPSLWCERISAHSARSRRSALPAACTNGHATDPLRCERLRSALRALFAHVRQFRAVRPRRPPVRHRHAQLIRFGARVHNRLRMQNRREKRSDDAMVTFVVWLVTWLALTFTLIAFLAAVNITSEYRHLSASGFPRPAFLIRRRIAGLLFRRRTPARPVPLEGRKAWVKWDVRWLTCGEFVATILRFGESASLYLELQDPLTISVGANNTIFAIRHVTFVPSSPKRAAYGVSAVSGYLEPQLPGGMIATATIVVYRSAI